jgi:hypothetical protein
MYKTSYEVLFGSRKFSKVDRMAKYIKRVFRSRGKA